MRIRWAVLAFAFACSAPNASTPAAAAYVPQTREITITTVPLLSKELMTTYPFLREVFGPKGFMAGKEVYAFVPNTITAVLGDTLRLQFVNPEDDAHAFVLSDLVVPLPGQQTTRATYIARHVGIYRFSCSVVAHLPSMWGQLVVLAPDAVTHRDAR